MKFNHIGVVVTNLEKSIQYYINNFEYEQIGGIIYDEVQKVRISFVGQKETGFTLELLESVGEDSPLKNALKKQQRLVHICYETPDIQQIIGNLLSKGFRLISGPVAAPAFNDRKIAFLFSRENEVFELVESEK